MARNNVMGLNKNICLMNYISVKFQIGVRLYSLFPYICMETICRPTSVKAIGEVLQCGL